MAMKPHAYLGRCLAFFVVFLLCSTMLQQIYVRLVVSRGTNATTDAQFYSEASPLTFLVMGDSHAKDGVDPSELGASAFNFASYGEGYFQTYWKLKRIVEEQPRQIETIILPLDDHSFASYRRYRIADTVYWQRYIDYLAVSRDHPELEGMTKFLTANLFGYFADGRSMAKALRKPEPLRSGFKPRPEAFWKLSESRRNLDATARARIHLGRGGFADPVLLEAFRGCLELGKAHGIRIVVVAFPVSREYGDALATYSARSVYRDEVDRILRSSPLTLFLDFQQVYFDRGEMFADPDHLSAQGSTEFSHLLGNTIRQSEAANVK